MSSITRRAYQTRNELYQGFKKDMRRHLRTRRRVALILLIVAPLWANTSLYGQTAEDNQTTQREATDNPSALSPSPPKADVFSGSGRFTNKSRRSVSETSVQDGGEITLNFINADIKDVAKAILGDYLHLNYEIGNVQGSVTIQTSQPLKRAQVLPVLQQTLKLNDIALVLSNGIYKVLPLSSARMSSGAVRTGGTGNTGYGIEIAPVRYISASEMAKLLEPLAPSEGVIHADAKRNILIIEGTEEERQIIKDNIALFDSDWLEGMSYALFTPSYTDAQELTKDLTQILGGTNSPITDMVRLIPISRLNTILAISPQRRYLDQLRAWVNRLDKPGQGSDRRVFVYHVQNGRASDLATTLSKALFGGTDGHPRQSSEGSAPPADLTISGTVPTQLPTYNVPISSGQGVVVGSVGSVNITADEANNALVILATPQEYSAIQLALRQLDTAPLQVFVEAAIAEITLNDSLKYGVQYFLQPDSESSIALSSAKTLAIAPSAPGFSYVLSQGGGIKVILDTLSGVTHVEVVSSPQLLVLNNQTATLQVGDRVPIATEQAVGVVTANTAIVNTIQYQDTGVILKITPRVNKGGVVMLDISQEISEVANTTSSTINSPTIQQRKVSSSVVVQDGETVALGGLITNTRNKISSGIPILHEIPVLGALFGNTENTSRRTELMVLITPHVVDSVKTARAVTEELKRKLPAVQTLFDRVR